MNLDSRPAASCPAFKADNVSTCLKPKPCVNAQPLLETSHKAVVSKSTANRPRCTEQLSMTWAQAALVLKLGNRTLGANAYRVMCIAVDIATIDNFDSQPMLDSNQN